MSKEIYLWYPEIVLKQSKILDAIEHSLNPEMVRETIAALEKVLSEVKKIHDQYKKEGKYNE